MYESRESVPRADDEKGVATFFHIRSSCMKVLPPPMDVGAVAGLHVWTPLPLSMDVEVVVVYMQHAHVWTPLLPGLDVAGAVKAHAQLCED